MTSRILIEELRFRAIVGVHAWERELPQEIRVSLQLELAHAKAGRSDELSDTVDYDTLSREVMRRARRARRRTLEALAEDLAACCLEEEGIEQVCVRVDKPGALRAARGVAVAITRGRGPRASEP
jgi:FolB domain-containing protein